MNNPTTCMCGKEMETCVYPKCREFTQPYKPQPQDIKQADQCREGWDDAVAAYAADIKARWEGK